MKLASRPWPSNVYKAINLLEVVTAYIFGNIVSNSK